jgi:DNA-binding NtrC family response regulator
MVSVSTDQPFHALILAEGNGQLKTVTAALRRRGATVTQAASLAEALSILDEKPAGLIVAHSTADAGLEEAISAFLAVSPSARVLAAGPNHDADAAVAAMKLGAADFLSVPLDEARTNRVIDSLLMSLAAGQDLGQPCDDDEILWNGHPPVVLVGQSPPMVNVRRMVRQLAKSQASVLITGETGTGKEIVASAIHRLRHGLIGPFVAVNCAQLSGGIMESQLFGHVKGAFTGAVSDNIGFFRAAEGGTIFLDEVSEMSSDLQAKLLRAIQEHVVTPVGSTTAVPVNADIVAATNRDPLRAVEESALRKDLYYRLAEVSLHLPPLRDRTGDVPHLVRWFISRFAQHYGSRPKRLEPGVLEFLLQHDWPGNIRELENVVHRVFTFGKAEGCFATAMVVQQMSTAAPARPGRGAAPAAAEAAPLTDQILPLADVEREAIERAMAATHGNISKASRLLGIERHRLARRIKSYSVGQVSKTNQSPLVGTSSASLF